MTGAWYRKAEAGLRAPPATVGRAAAHLSRGVFPWGGKAARQAATRRHPAQGAALMEGQAGDDPARAYPGDRPSATMLCDDIDPATLGALLDALARLTGVRLGDEA